MDTGKPETTKESPNGGRPYLLIQVTEESGLDVVGCVGDMVRSFGLLEAAKLEIYQFHMKANQPKIVKGGMMDWARRK